MLGDNPTSRWAFLTHIANAYGPTPETGFYYDYQDLMSSLQASFTVVPVLGCADARNHVVWDGAFFEEGWGCLTDEEKLELAVEKAANDLADWYMNGNGCPRTLELLGAATGWGAVRLIIKKANKKIMNKAIQGASPVYIAEVSASGELKRNAWSAMGAMVGYVLGDKLENLVCNELKELL